VSARLDIADIKHAAKANIARVLAELGVHAPLRGNFISMCNPMVKDLNPSFTIWTTGEYTGAWKDWRNSGAGGDQGDIIDLVSYLSGWWWQADKGRPQAIRWLIATLGLDRVDPAQLARDRALAQRRQAELVKKHDEELAGNRRRALELFAAASALIDGTLVDRYLQSRGIELAALPSGPLGGKRRPHIIRYCPSAWHPESKQELPCMVAGCTNQAGKIQAVHRTFLARDGRGKANVTPARKVWPSSAGLVIPLWRGESNLMVREAIACGLRETLVLTEGIEDGLSAVMAVPQFRTWAFISLGNLANVRLPECIDGVILHRQNEWENLTAVAAFERGKRALETQGRAVVEVHAAIGKDLNDTLRGAA
jgi:hypothetical protein